MFSFLSTERLARASARRPWLTVGVWVVLLVAGGFAAMGVGDVLTTDQDVTVELESTRAQDLVTERLRDGEEPVTEQVIVQSQDKTVDESEFSELVALLLVDIRRTDRAVESATSFYETADPSLVSDDRHTLLIPVTLHGGEPEDEAKDLIGVLEQYDGREGFTVLTAGDGSLSLAFTETSEKDLQTAELFGLPVALIILAVVFGALVAAGIPVVLALVAITISVGVTAIIGRQFELSFFVVNMITMMGLAVGIDYSLFTVERFREERRRGATVPDAVGIAGATASRAVFFSGLTVIVGLAGLMIVPDTIFRSLSAGAIIVVVLAVLAALTLLPAVLALLGDRVNALRIPFIRASRSPEHDGGFWAGVARNVMARPVLSVVLSVGLLLAAAVPYFSIQLGFSGISTLPRGNDVYHAFTILDQEFSAGLIEPARIVVDADDVSAPGVQAGIERLRERLAADPQFGASTVETSAAGDLALIEVPVPGDSQGDAAHAAVERLREEYVPEAFGNVDAEVSVGGATAGTRDYYDVINDYTPIVFAFVLGLSFVVLLVMFRSIVVPVKAIIMNLLSVGAAYGLVVLVIQQGVGNELFGFQQVERIETWVPLFLFAILFGLSMDYHVFLLSRIRERFDATGDNAASVAFGVRSTAHLITGAALIMVAVFAGFAMGEWSPLQQMGFGLAAAVMIDATIVRSVLVPASMVLLGDFNWYLPGWLNWLPKVQVEGRPAAAPAPVHGAFAAGGD